MTTLAPPQPTDQPNPHEHDIVEWAFQQWRTRVLSGVTSGDAAQQIVDLIVAQDRCCEWVHATGTRTIQALSAQEARKERGGSRPPPASNGTSTVGPAQTPAPDAPATPGQHRAERRGRRKAEAANPTPSVPPTTTFGDTRHPGTLSYYDVLINMVKGNRWIRVGDMRRDDWREKAREQRTKAAHAAERAEFCQRMAKLVPANARTQDVISEDNLRDMWPEDGF